jgi:hypothetical protein
MIDIARRFRGLAVALVVLAVSAGIVAGATPEARVDERTESPAAQVQAEPEAPAPVEHPDNPGKAVSEAARGETPDGYRNHGEYVSEVARDQGGRPEGAGNGLARGHAKQAERAAERGAGD